MTARAVLTCSPASATAWGVCSPWLRTASAPGLTAAWQAEVQRLVGQGSWKEQLRIAIP